ncbi:DUF1080 domain-containing protein [candidate division KSB1 bacterium]|nr:DUF1080 domain-containing protein [candidate division KSB1 bacterium]
MIKTKWIISLSILVSVLFCISLAVSAELAESQQKWYERYSKQENAPEPKEMLLNTDPEPDLSEGFVSLFNGKDLTGWTPKGGSCEFKAQDGMIVGITVPGSPSTYLCTDRNDFSDFIFTCDMYYVVDGNTGVMFRAREKGSEKITVYGPQAEMENFSRKRYWSGGIYGQSCGGWYYPLWLDVHDKVRGAMKEDQWNRLTIYAKDNVVKTWVNGIPAAHWVNDEYLEGFFGLQIHSGKQGTIQWRNLMVRELK